MADTFSFEDANTAPPASFSFEEASGGKTLGQETVSRLKEAGADTVETLKNLGSAVKTTLVEHGKNILHPEKEAAEELRAVAGTVVPLAAQVGGLVSGAYKSATTGSNFPDTVVSEQERLAGKLPDFTEGHPLAEALTQVAGAPMAPIKIAGDVAYDLTKSPLVGALTQAAAGAVLPIKGELAKRAALAKTSDQIGASLKAAGVNPDVAAAVQAQADAYAKTAGPQHPSVHIATAVQGMKDAVLQALSPKYAYQRTTGGLTETEAKAALAAHVVDAAKRTVPYEEPPAPESDLPSTEEAAQPATPERPGPIAGATAAETASLTDLDAKIASEPNKHVLTVLKKQRAELGEAVEKRAGAVKLQQMAIDALKLGDRTTHDRYMAEAEKLNPTEAPEAPATAPEEPEQVEATPAPAAEPEPPLPVPEVTEGEPEAATATAAPEASPEPPPGFRVDKSVGLGGGKSLDGAQGFISRMIPQFVEVPTRSGGTATIPVWDEIAAHENAEHPNIAAKGYDKAHNTDGNAATAAFLEPYDVDPRAYQNVLRPHLKSAELDALQNPDNVPGAGEKGRGQELDHRVYAKPWADTDATHLLGEQHPWNRLNAGKRPIAARAKAHEAALKEHTDGTDRNAAEQPSVGIQGERAVSGEEADAGSGAATERNSDAATEAEGVSDASQVRSDQGQTGEGGKAAVGGEDRRGPDIQQSAETGTEAGDRAGAAERNPDAEAEGLTNGPNTGKSGRSGTANAGKERPTEGAAAPVEGNAQAEHGGGAGEGEGKSAGAKDDLSKMPDDKVRSYARGWGIKDAATRDPESLRQEIRSKRKLNADQKYPDPPKEESEKIEAAAKSGSVIDLAKHIADHAPSEYYRAIAKRVQHALARMQLSGVKFGLNVAHRFNSIPDDLGNQRGYTEVIMGPDEHSANVWLNGSDLTGKVGTGYEVALHELIHAATAGAIHLGGLDKFNGTVLHGHVQDLLSVASAVTEHFNKRVAEAKAGGTPLTEFEQSVLKKEANALENPHEVVTWGLTNTEMQHYLEGIHYPGRQTLWSRFVSSIRNMLRLPANADTALSEILHVGNELLDDHTSTMTKALSTPGKYSAIASRRHEMILSQRSGASSEATGPKKATVNAEREARGAEPLDETATREFGDAWNRPATSDVDKQQALIDKLSKKQRPVTVEEVAQLTHRGVTLKNQRRANDADMIRTREAGGDVSDHIMEAARIEDEQTRLEKATRNSIGENARAMRAMQEMIEPDYSRAATESKMRAAQDGHGLSEGQQKQIDDLQNKLDEAQKQVADAEAKKTPDAAKYDALKKDFDALKKKHAENPETAPAGKTDKVSAVGGMVRNRLKRGDKTFEEVANAIHDEDPTVSPTAIEKGWNRLAAAEPARKLGKAGNARKSILDRYKTALQKQIDDLQGQIDGGVKNPPKGKTATELDDEAKALKTKRDELKKEHAAIFGGNALTDEQRLNRLKISSVKKAEDYRRRLAANNLELAKRKPPVMDAELMALKAKEGAAKVAIDRAIMKQKLESRGKIQHAIDLIPKWTRFSFLSNPATILKLGAAAGWRLGLSPIKEAIGGALGVLPGIRNIAKLAPIQGGLNLQAEAKVLSTILTKTPAELKTIWKTGHDSLDALYGKKKDIMPFEPFLGAPGRIHAMIKEPVKQAAWTRAFQKQMADGKARGVDNTDPMTQMRYGIAAYKEAQRAVFQQDNWLNTAWNNALHTMQPNKVGDAVANAGKNAVRIGLETLLPITKVPTNIVFEAAQHVFGLGEAGVRAAYMVAKGMEKATPEEAELFMRALKNGTTGGLLLTFGLMFPKMFGGFWQPGDKGTDYNTIKVDGTTVKPIYLHNPALEVPQIAATAARVADMYDHGDKKGWGLGSAAAALGLFEQTPFVDSVMGAGSLRENPGKHIDQAVVSRVIPGGIQQVARWMDHDAQGNPIKRDPHGLKQEFEAAIPGLRQRVPRK